MHCADGVHLGISLQPVTTSCLRLLEIVFKLLHPGPIGPLTTNVAFLSTIKVFFELVDFLPVLFFCLEDGEKRKVC